MGPIFNQDMMCVTVQRVETKNPFKWDSQIKISNMFSADLIFLNGKEINTLTTFLWWHLMCLESIECLSCWVLMMGPGEGEVLEFEHKKSSFPNFACFLRLAWNIHTARCVQIGKLGEVVFACRSVCWPCPSVHVWFDWRGTGWLRQSSWHV